MMWLSAIIRQTVTLRSARNAWPRLGLAAVGVALAACTSAPALVPYDGSTQTRIARIERDLIPIDAAGADSGPPQSLSSRMADLEVPGLSLAVFDSGRIIWTRSYGVADVITGAAVDSSTLFQAASISKPVTSVAMFRLVEQGRLSLDENVNVLLKSWTVPDNGFTQVQKVTPLRIVTHMAGLTVGGFAGYARGEPIPTVQQLLPTCGPLPLT